MNNKIKEISKLVKESSFFHGELALGEHLQKILTEAHVANLFKKTITESHENVYLAGFKDGNTYKDVDLDILAKDCSEKNLYSKLEKLPCSARITNVQILSKELKEITMQMYKQLGFPVTINMYITPGADKNCFLCHPDPQETLVFQIKGRKKWFVPQDDNGEYIIARSQQDVESVKENKNYSFEFKEKDFIFLPHCMLHKAEAYEDELSIHISFAIATHFKSSFELFIKDELDRALESKDTYYDKMTDDSAIKWINKVRDTFCSVSDEEFLEKIRARINKEELKTLKLGRPYGFADAINDDPK